MVWWDPFEEWERARRLIMGRMFLPLKEELESFPVDVSETEDEVIIKADLPGFEKTDVAIRATEDSIEISAQHKEVKKEKTEKMFRAERRYGAVRRYLTLPCKVEYEKARAEMKNGVLTLRIPKREKKKVGKEIKVE